MVDPFTAITATVTLTKGLVQAVKKTSAWRKRKENTAWKEDDRMEKIVCDYFERNGRGRRSAMSRLPELEVLTGRNFCPVGRPIPGYIQTLIDHLESRNLSCDGLPEGEGSDNHADNRSDEDHQADYKVCPGVEYYHC
jgi:hypothetical protein